MLANQRLQTDNTFMMVRLRGLEPPRAIRPQRPQRCASTSSATAAYIVI